MAFYGLTDCYITLLESHFFFPQCSQFFVKFINVIFWHCITFVRTHCHHHNYARFKYFYHKRAILRNFLWNVQQKKIFHLWRILLFWGLNKIKSIFNFILSEISSFYDLFCVNLNLKIPNIPSILNPALKFPIFKQKNLHKATN